MILLIRCSSLLLLFVTFSAFAKPRVIITKFADKTGVTACNGRKIWTGDLGGDLQKQFVTVMNNYNSLRVLNMETPQKGIAPQYSVSGVVRNFEQCGTGKRTVNAKVAIDIRVTDTKTGLLAFTYGSRVDVSGASSRVFKASPIGQATYTLINDLAFRVQQALLSRKPTTHLVSKNRKAASSEYQLQLFRKDNEPLPSEK